MTKIPRRSGEASQTKHYTIRRSERHIAYDFSEAFKEDLSCT